MFHTEAKGQRDPRGRFSETENMGLMDNTAVLTTLKIFKNTLKTIECMTYL